MGSNTSKLRKALQRGEEVEAMHIYLKNPDIKRNLDPSGSYGDSYDNNTALHYASSYAMKHFIRSFLVERGNPNKRNSKNQTAIHCICTTVRGTEETVDTHRAECLSSFVQWKGKDSESIELDAVDKDGNTALHCAAMSGLLQCVQLLVANRASLYIENNDGLTACDCAIHKNFNNIAAFLETKMVFSEHGVTSDEIAVEPVFIPDEKQKYRGLCEQDLQEAKDQLLVETADMLRVPLFTAEALLRYYEWSREQLVEGWMSDPAASCEKAGVKLPPNHCADKEMFQATASELRQSDKSIETCDICADEIKTDEGLLGLSCTHEFCRGCWESYLNFKIEEGDAHNIQCPMFACNTLVPQDIIESLVSKEMVSRYLKFDIKAFVESNPNLKWCPAPRCGRAVRLPPDSSPSLDVAKKHGETAPLIVDCGNGHYFCWNCLNDAHEPCSCEQWQKWLNKIAEMLPKLPAREHLSECPETEVVANTLWLVTNSKPCPNCKSPIEKNEGCNHVKCTKCKYEFCWVCLELWKLHSSATGGYFKCNRFEVVQKLAEDSQKVVNEVSSAHKKIMELNYFLHYYSRFKNHENSYKLEEPLLGTAKDKMVALALAAQETAAAPESIDTSFIEDAVSQLLMSRRVLRASYGYGFFLVGSKDKKTLSYEQDRKTMFELMQTEVEEATEEVSQMVARPYLRTPRSRIIQCTQTLQRKRKEFLLALSRGLIPDEEPPFVFPSDNNPFSRLRFHFPGMNDESDEDEENYEEFRRMIESSIREQITRRLVAQESFGEDVAASIEATPPQAATRICARNGCERPRSIDRLSGLPFKYCSLDCLRRDRGGLNTANSPENRLRRRRRRRRKANREHDVDHFVRAIQLSVQEERDESSPPRNLSQRTSSSSSSDSSENENAQADSSRNAAAFSNSESEESASFQRAIELSIQASRDNHPKTPGSNQDHDSRDFNLDYDLRRAIELSLQESLVADGDTPHSTIISKSGDLENAESRQSNLLPIQTEDAESSESDEFLTVL